MSSLHEIESAISALSSEDRARLVRDLPGILPEWVGELAWQRILHDPNPSPALSALADSIDEEFAKNPEAFPEISDADFEQR